MVGVRDDQTVPRPLPRQRNQFTVVGSQVTAPAARGAFAIDVESSVGMAVGDIMQLMLDSGVPFQFTLGGIVGNTLQWSGLGLPATVGTLYGDPIENQVIDLTSINGIVGLLPDLLETEDGGGDWLFEDNTVIEWG